jgi:cytochrome c biogenesis factor
MDARPRLFPSPTGDGVIRKPAIANHGELYLSPVDVAGSETREPEPVWLSQGEAVEVHGAAYTFRGFRMESHQQLAVFADITVQKDGRTFEIAPGLKVGAGERAPVEARIDGIGSYTIARIDADHHRVALAMPAAATQPVAFVDFSRKPLISLVWVGALLAIVGAILAGLRRAGERSSARSPAAAKARERVRAEVSPALPQASPR